MDANRAWRKGLPQRRKSLLRAEHSVGWRGISRGARTVIRSTVTGNDTQGGVDLASQRPPRVRDSTCGSSLDSQAMVPWGVCAND